MNRGDCYSEAKRGILARTSLTSFRDDNASLRMTKSGLACDNVRINKPMIKYPMIKYPNTLLALLLSSLLFGCATVCEKTDQGEFVGDTCQKARMIEPVHCCDDDRDGVSNHQDQCPNTLQGSEVDDKGCAVCGKMLAELKSHVLFDFNKCDLKPDDVLNALAKRLINAHIRIRLEGHADAIGSKEQNLALSRCRAQAVKKHLESQGVDSDNIVTEGKGKAFPIASNQTEQGRRKNRRVEISVTCKTT
uniref:Outer membrane protein OmpA n=1 Tax=Candidatus Kentrum sp. MB TaxID=2138164 RepID=A0A450XXS7_9GAMM|nr:MAG: Outer membrane protein OmpA [Candidatus Kentron sp. MB]VFK34101.1 MAG: Outer membrane protein OmpA [Candidatus Kentron sp. MB]VFK76739.1 MAG: Outer membrane protein OmpA [Candidatus Kentron sp. MB]